MAKFEVGDLVVLKSGSMRMCVEAAEEDRISTVWCNDGVIGRDSFAPALLNKAEERAERPAAGRPDHRGGHRGDDRGERGHRGGHDRDRERDDRPRGKPGWDGKPRDKKYFRKDG
jgi:uncharacterized protein YodC (DUF2158 family)